MSGVNLSNFGLLFTKYLPDANEVMNDMVVLRNMVNKSQDWQGDYIQKALHVGRNTGLGPLEDGGAFVPAGNQSYVSWRADRRFLQGSVKISLGLLDNASTTENVAKTVVESELRGFMDSYRKWENFYLSRDGTGAVGTVVAYTPGATTIDLTDGRMMWEGAWYEVRNSGGGTIRGHVQVVSVQRAPLASGAARVTIAAAAPAGTAATDILYWCGSSTSNLSTFSRVPNGLLNMFDDTLGTFQNVNCALYPRWTSICMTNGGVARALTPTLFRQAHAALYQEAGLPKGSEITALGSVWQCANVETMYEGQTLFAPTDTVGGVKVQKFQSSLGSVNFVCDPDAPYGRMFLFPPEEITRYTQRELGWLPGNAGSDVPGGGIFRLLENHAAYQAIAAETLQYVVEGRNKAVRIDDLIETRITARG